MSFCLILLSALFLSACGVKDNNSSTTTPSQPQEESVTSFSLRDLITKNIPQKCTWSSNFEGSKSNGSMIISGQKFNQEVEVKQEEVVSTIHSISDGTYIYTWQENSSQTIPTAFKMKLETVQGDKKEPTSDYSASVQTMDLDEQYQYNCSPTIVSESDFQPPKNIEFTDYSQFLDEIKSNIPSIDPSSLE